MMITNEVQLEKEIQKILVSWDSQIKPGIDLLVLFHAENQLFHEMVKRMDEIVEKDLHATPMDLVWDYWVKRRADYLQMVSDMLGPWDSFYLSTVQSRFDILHRLIVFGYDTSELEKIIVPDPKTLFRPDISETKETIDL